VKTLPPGASYQGQFTGGPGDLASALGNAGVHVVSSPTIIGQLEMACCHVMEPHFEDGEASVGVGFSLRHVGAAFPGRAIELSAELVSQHGQRFVFRVKAQQDGRTIMAGEHERALVHLDRFLKAAPLAG
jgi:predicted thioesterase